MPSCHALKWSPRQGRQRPAGCRGAAEPKGRVPLRALEWKLYAIDDGMRARRGPTCMHRDETQKFCLPCCACGARTTPISPARKSLHTVTVQGSQHRDPAMGCVQSTPAGAGPQAPAQPAQQQVRHLHEEFHDYKLSLRTTARMCRSPHFGAGLGSPGRLCAPASNSRSRTGVPWCRVRPAPPPPPLP